MNNKKKILLDVDEVICFSGFLPLINEFMGTNYVIDDFSDYYIDEVVIPKDRFELFNKFIENKNMYDYATLLPDSVESIKYLNDLYNIYICSSCINPFNINGSGRLFADKYNYLINILPFLKPENFIFTNAKNMLKADIQIDDRLSNLNNDIETKILFPSYHNKDITLDETQKFNVVRAGYDYNNGWNEVVNILTNNTEKTYCKRK